MPELRRARMIDETASLGHHSRSPLGQGVALANYDARKRTTLRHSAGASDILAPWIALASGACFK